VNGDVGTYSETYDTKTQGLNKVLTPAVVSILDATSASMTGNYSITYATNTSGVITKLPIILTASTNTKVYDGTVSATATPTITTGALVSGDVGTYSETYDTKVQGTSKVLTPSATILDATNTIMTGNYSITYTNINTGVITTKQLTIADPTITKSKEYDKTLTANTTAGTLSGVVTVGSATDVVTASAVGTYSTSTVGTSKTITVVYTLAGADKDNYIKPVDKVYTDGVITAKQLTITAKPHTILYNGTNYSGGNGVNLTEMASGESISNLTGTLNYTGTSQGAKNVDIYTIIPNGLSSPNYNIVYVGDNLEIKQATLKVIAGNQSVNFGTPAAKILTDATFTYASLLGGDNASAITGSLSYSTNYTPLTSTGSAGIYIEPIISGLSAANYNLIAEKGNITITASPSSPVFQIPNAFTPNSDGHNDTFKIIQNGYVTSIISFRVFTKSGKLIFSDKDGAWDGRYGGVMLDADVYIWIADFINKNNVTEHLSGTVLLLK
jgi:gliding motility-associated-like protein